MAQKSRKILYIELAGIYLDSAHEEVIDQLIDDGLLIKEFDAEEWANASQEERENEEVSHDYFLNPKNTIYDLKTVVEVSSGKYYHKWNDYAEFSDELYKGYETREYSKYIRDTKQGIYSIKAKKTLNKPKNKMHM